MNLFFYLAAWFYLSRYLSRKTGWYCAGAITFFFMSSFSFLHWLQEVRMYAFYALSCFYIMTKIDEREDGVMSFREMLLHLLFYFNFFLYCLPLSCYLYLKRKKDKRTQRFSILIFVFILIKLPYLIWWRLFQRSGGLQINPFDVISVLGKQFISGLPVYSLLAWTFVILSFVYGLRKDQFASKRRIHYLLIGVALLLMLLLPTLFHMHEIELRYFLFLYPIIILLSSSLFERLTSSAAQFFIASIFVIVGSFNCSQMYLRGEVNGGEVKRAANFVASHGWKNEIIWVDDPYFFYHYVGVYSQLLTSGKPQLKRLEELGTEQGKQYYVSVQQTLEEHQKKLTAKGIIYKTIWNSQNLIQSQTIISEFELDKQRLEHP